VKPNLLLLIAFITYSSFGSAQEFHLGVRRGLFSLIGLEAGVRFPILKQYQLCRTLPILELEPLPLTL
jgi:hypothetical protein